MSADGPEQRTAAFEERSEREYDDIDRIERREEERVAQPLLDSPAQRIADKDAILRDLIMGADMMLQPALQLSGAMRGYIQEVKRVAQAGLRS